MTVADQIMFPPLHNGLDYLESVIKHLRDEPDQQDLKYAVLHLQAAVEVLLKARLIREHWSLVFEDLSKANRVAFASGDFKSLTLDGTLARLTNIVGVEISRPAREQFRELAKRRNKLQHFGMEEHAIAIENLAGQVLDGLLCFIGEHLRPPADFEEEQVLDRTQELIRTEMGRIDALVTARWQRIEPDLAARAGIVVHCPDCQHSALPIDEDLRCLFCDRAWEPDDAASEYAGTVLGFSWYDNAGVSNGPVHKCMDCGSETLVRGATVRRNPDASVWVCFKGCLIVGDDEIGGCLKCGEPMRMDEESGTVCEDCFSYIVNRD